MTNNELFMGLLANAVARQYSDVGRINAAIYAKANGVSLGELGQTTIVINPPPAAEHQAVAVPPTAHHRPRAAPVPQQLYLIEEQQQPDGTWREISRTAVDPTTS